MYKNLNDLILHPFISFLFSVILLLGLSSFGFILFFLLDQIFKKSLFAKFKKRFLDQLVFGFILISILINYLVLFELIRPTGVKSISVLICIFGILFLPIVLNKIYNVRRFYFKQIREIEFPDVLIFGNLIGYFLLSIAPPTDADSLNYHLSIPLIFLNENNIIPDLGFFHERLIGSGEIFGLVYLNLGAEQFSSLLQFVGILLILRGFKKLGNLDKKFTKFIQITFLSIPVLIFLVSSSKMQMFPLGIISFGLVNIFRLVSKKNENSLMLFVFIIPVVFSVSLKYSFLLYAWLVFIFLVFNFKSKKRIFLFSMLFLLIYLIFILPFAYYRVKYLGVSVFYSAIDPLNGDIPGLGKFKDYLKSYQDTSLGFPYFLFFPNYKSPGTTFIGASLLILLLAFDNLKYKRFNGLFLLFLLDLLLTRFFLQQSSRFYLESFALLCVYLLTISDSENRRKLIRFIQIPIFSQALIVLLISIYFGINLVTGLFSVSSRKNMMRENAFGYGLSEMSYESLPVNSKLLFNHTSLVFSKRRPFSDDWMRFVDTCDDFKYFITYLQKSGVNYFLVRDGNYSDRYLFNDSMINEAILDIPKESRIPLNRNQKYSAKIVKLNKENWMGCFRK
ncbi:hypothetical protein LPTSP2_06280 [Leptospira ellinghausenii]|uniref:Glycosyltransferase RgtA/B/C/D-like domain-containing protein n=1 Tax=Leptospira ellinghausenii TaxID=1917822 RepID=A0A2P2D9N2_9LEPT|nr:DUF1420 family protein [Leptospira ellinghausenii]GBF41356.1 hypothetical protein LPTSP2_06280 [Leptospira ellinghausenii]